MKIKTPPPKTDTYTRTYIHIYINYIFRNEHSHLLPNGYCVRVDCQNRPVPEDRYYKCKDGLGSLEAGRGCLFAFVTSWV